MSKKPLFSFGVIADLQYTNFPNSRSFKGYERFHRNALRQVRSLFAPYPHLSGGLNSSLTSSSNNPLNNPLSNTLNHTLNNTSNSPSSNASNVLSTSTSIPHVTESHAHHTDYSMLFTIHLGDLIDINAKDAPKLDMHTIISEFEACYRGRVWHMTSNHDFYNMKRDDVLDFFGIGFDGEGNPFSLANSLNSSHTDPYPLHHIHLLGPDYKYLNWDEYKQLSDSDFENLWNKHFEILENHPRRNDYFIFNDSGTRVLRLRRDLLANLPKSRKGWKNLFLHEKELHLLEKRLIEKMNTRIQETKMMESHPSNEKENESMIQNQEIKSDSTYDVCKDRKAYYSFDVDQFKFIVLDTYEISILAWPKGHPNRALAEEIIEKYHPIGVSTSINSSTHLKGDDRRFVAFNGGIGRQQIEWVLDQIRDAKSKGQRVIICSHVPLLPLNDDSTAYLWNYKECLDAFYQEGEGVIVAYLSGHAHRGGCRFDEKQACHITLEGSIESFDDCFGEVFVYEDGMELVGRGVANSYEFKFPKYPSV